jgi:hypothetical protein
MGASDVDFERLIGFADEVYASLQPCRDSSGVTARSDLPAAGARRGCGSS